LLSYTTMLPNPKLKEVALKDYLKVVKKRLWLVISLAVIIPLAVAVYIFQAPPVYRSSASVLVKAAPGKFENPAARALAESVFGALDLKRDPDFHKVKDPVAKLQHQIKIEHFKESGIILVQVEDTQAYRAAIIANAWAKVYSGQNNAVIVDAAKPLPAPIRPQKAKSIILAILFSLIGAIGLAFLWEYLDCSIRTAEEITLYLNLPFLGYIPAIQDKLHPEEKNLICHESPESNIAESFRAVRTAMLFASSQDKPLKTIVVTSPVGREGKSFVAANLAIIFSHANERVALLELARPNSSVSRTFNLEEKPGETIKPTFVSNLTLVSPGEVLSADKARLLLEELKSKFERIIIDAPAILKAQDLSSLLNAGDGVVLVIRGARTCLRAALAAKEKIFGAKARIIGAVLNNIEAGKEDGYYYKQVKQRELKNKEA